MPKRKTNFSVFLKELYDLSKNRFKKRAETYDLSLDPIICPKCGLSQELKNPVAFEEWRGIESDLHSCGPKYQASVFKTINKDTKRIWNQLQLKLR